MIFNLKQFRLYEQMQSCFCLIKSLDVITGKKIILS